MQRLKGDVRQPWADGPRTQQCDGLAFSQVTYRGDAGSGKPLIRRVRNAGCEPAPWIVLGRPDHVAKNVDRSATGASCARRSARPLKGYGRRERRLAPWPK